MYKYYSLERPVSLGTYPKKGRLVGFENFESELECIKKHITDNGKEFYAWGYLLLSNKLSDKDVNDYELAYAGEVNSLTRINELPLDLQEDVRAEINGHYNRYSNGFVMSRKSFVDIYGKFTLDDFCKMLPSAARKFAFGCKDDYQLGAFSIAV